MTKTIKAAEFVRDFKSGMGDHALMAKYELTAAQFDRLIEELSSRNLISDSEVEDRFDITDSQITKAFAYAKEDSKELP